MNKSIFELERDVKDQYSEDKSDPRLYLVIRDLTEAILVRKSYVFTAEEADEVSHALASDLYLKLNDKESDFTIVAWTKYIMMIGRRYVDNYVTEFKRKHILDLSDPVDYYESPYVYRGSMKLSKFEMMSTEDIILSITEVVTESIEEFSKYDLSTTEYDDLLMSVKLSLVYSKLVVYGCSIEREVKFILKLIDERLKSYVVTSIDSNYEVEDISSKVTSYELYEDIWI